MAKKKTTSLDRHSSGFMVRLPEEYREVLRQMRIKFRRSMTEEIKVALEDHFKNHGFTFPKPE